MFVDIKSYRINVEEILQYCPEAGNKVYIEFTHSRYLRIALDTRAELTETLKFLDSYVRPVRFIYDTDTNTSAVKTHPYTD